MADTTLPGVLLTGDHASRPAANAVATGTLYACSTHDLIYQSDGSSWSTWSDVTGSGASVLTTAGDILYRDGSGLQRLAIGSADEVLTVNAGATAPEWSAAAGGGLTQAYVGYNTVGGSTEAMTGNRVYAKKVTLANDCLLTDIEAYVINQSGNNDSVSDVRVALYSDSAGDPLYLLQTGPLATTNLILDKTSGASGWDARWFGGPIGRWLTAGDYWIAVQTAQSNRLNIYYDGSGSDRYIGPGSTYIPDWSFLSATTTTNRYSIRANTIR